MDISSRIAHTNTIILEHAKKYNYPYKLFGIFGVITYPLFYFLWGGLNTTDYLNLTLRLVATILCLLLAVHHYWPDRLQKILPMYWYVTVCYCLPYLFTLLSLRGGLSNIWLLNSLTVVVLMILLLDTASLITVFFVGTILGLVTYKLLFGRIVYLSDINYFYVIISYISTFIFGVIFSHYKQLSVERSFRIEAERSNEMKSEFIANMSHDIRTPISGISGMLDGILYELTDFQKNLDMNSLNSRDSLKKSLSSLVNKVNDYACDAKSSCDSLSILFNEVLEVAKIDSTDIDDTKKKFNLASLVSSCENLCRPMASIKNIKLSIKIANCTPHVLFGYDHYLKRIILNLIGNAIKFTNEGGVYVQISTSEEENGRVMLYLSVKDTGIGISKDYHQSIFDKFTRIIPSYKGVYKGVGLGLYEVKKYVDLMNGNISLDSSLGVGTSFTLELPFYTGNNIDEKKQISHSDVNRINRKDHHTPLTVLLVEDNAIAAKAAKIIIERIGCIVDIATSGREAIKVSKNKLYDVVFMDIGLPDADGISVSETIIESSDRYIPIIALTGHASDEMEKSCLRSGMISVLTKPATEEKIKNVLKKIISNFN